MVGGTGAHTLAHFAAPRHRKPGCARREREGSGVARLFAIADACDALTSRRPCKEPWPVDDALARIEKNAGSHFDPALVAAFVPIAGEVYRQYGQADQAQPSLCLRHLMRQHYLGLVTQISAEAPQAA